MVTIANMYMASDFSLLDNTLNVLPDVVVGGSVAQLLGDGVGHSGEEGEEVEMSPDMWHLYLHHFRVPPD